MAKHPQTGATALSQGPGPIGVFDSGVGGLSVLAELVKAMPAQDFVYLADSGFAPYGEKPLPAILQRCQLIASHLLGHLACKGLVIACNTATAVAAEPLRLLWPDHPVVGVEPGVKPAAALSRNGRIGVMATPATLASHRYTRLVQNHAGGLQVMNQPCPGLALALEEGQAERTEVLELLDAFCTPLNQWQADTVVLGCTHYHFAANAISRRLAPGCVLVDTAQAVARQACRVMPPIASCVSDSKETSRQGQIVLLSSGPPEKLQRIARQWLGTQASNWRFGSFEDGLQEQKRFQDG
jgi:glutamate racemase